jgi:hypothetical protein
MIARRPMSVTVAWLCAVAGALAVAAPSASGAVTHQYLSQITEVPAGSGVTTPGALSTVNKMAIDSGNLYVSENVAGVDRLDEFNSMGAFTRQFALPSSLYAYFDYFGLAAGHGTGEEQVYVGAEDSEYKDFVAVFDGEGHPIGEPWSGSDTPSGPFSPVGIAGIAADSSASLGDWAAGDVYVSDSNTKVIDVFKPLPGGKEEYVTRIEGPEAGVSFGQPSLVAVDQANGDVVVVDESHAVDIFEPTVLGKYVLVRKLTGTPAGPFQSIATSGEGLAVDSNGDIYVAESTSESAVYQFSATGEYLGRLTGTPARAFHSVSSLAIDPQTHELYVGDNANSETEEPGAVDIFGPNLVIPDVTTGSASSVEPTSATISGTVDPDSAGEATCEVAWGTTIEFGNITPCPAPIASGASPVPVQLALTGLSPDTTYHYRLQAANANGFNQGEPHQDQEFHTPGPGIHEAWSADVASSSVTLSARIDPNGSATTYYFQYGTSSSYGTDVPVAPGASIGAASDHMYSRDMVTHETMQVDAAQPGADGGRGAPRFQLASADGSKVFFTDSARLTVDSTAGISSSEPDLYEFDVATGRLTDLTVDANHGEHANVQGLVQGASEDGSYVYLVANGVLAPGAKPGSHCGDVSPPASASCNLYVRHAGRTTYIAALSGTDQQWDNEQGRAPGSLTARVSPNGRWFAFMSDRSLTGYDNRDANSGEPDEEVFLYDASANRLRCVSCDPTGARPVGVLGPQGSSNHPGPLVDRSNIWGERWYAALIPGTEQVSLGASAYQSRYLSDSGRLFFDSNEALVPQDVNGTLDVYEYEPEGEGGCARASSTFEEASNGCVGLISSGSSAEESAFMDASESGDDVFFLTAARLRPEDYDNAPDLYDARVCTASSPCLPLPAAISPPCVTGDGCKPAPSPQPSVFGAAPSATFSGAGNVAATATPSVTHRVLKRSQKLAAALRACHKRRHDKRKQAACVRRARKRYASKPIGKRSVALRARGSSTTSGH